MSYSELPIKVEGIIYREVDDHIEILLLKRSPEDGGFWQPLTGTLEFNESLSECLLRELQEETGITQASIGDEIHRFNWTKKDYVVVELVYPIEVGQDQEVTISDEHEVYKWCSPEEAREMMAMPSNREALEKFLRYFR